MFFWEGVRGEVGGGSRAGSLVRAGAVGCVER